MVGPPNLLARETPNQQGHQATQEARWQAWIVHILRHTPTWIPWVSRLNIIMRDKPLNPHLNLLRELPHCLNLDIALKL